MAYVITASRNLTLITREEEDDATIAYRRAAELLRVSHLVTLANKDTGVTQHYRNKRPVEVAS